jgi:hypothetical protein
MASFLEIGHKFSLIICGKGMNQYSSLLFFYCSDIICSSAILLMSINTEKRFYSLYLEHEFSNSVVENLFSA